MVFGGARGWPKPGLRKAIQGPFPLRARRAGRASLCSGPAARKPGSQQYNWLQQRNAQGDDEAVETIGSLETGHNIRDAQAP